MHVNSREYDLNVDQGSGNNIKKHLLAKIAIGFIEFILGSILYSYGILLSEYVKLEEYTDRDAIWTSLLFFCSSCFMDPTSRFITDYFEDRKQTFLRYFLGLISVILFMVLMVPHNIISYTIGGGILSNLISTYLSSFAIDKLNIDHNVFEGFRQISRALSLFIMPQFCYFLLLHLQVTHAKLILAAIVWLIIPASLLIKLPQVEDQVEMRINEDIYRYQTIGRISHQMEEMKKFGKTDEIERNSTSSSSDDNDENFSEPIYESVVPRIDYFDSSEHDVLDLAPPPSHLSALAVKSYFHNAGVCILPGIPEESEDEDINYINPKRLSVISTKLEELNLEKQSRVYNINEDSIQELFDIDTKKCYPEPINTIEFIPNFKNESVSVLDELKNMSKSKHCFQCSPYQKYIWKRRLRMFKDFCVDNLLRPLYYALKTMYFYPALFTRLVSGSLSTLYITLVPFKAMQKHWSGLVFNTENATFLLTYVAFAWSFFLVTLPLIVKLTTNKVRLVFSFGLVISGSSLLILAAKPSNDVLTISSLLFGIGYGIISYTEKWVYKASIGMRPWYLVRGCLEVLSASLTLLAYLIISSHELDLHQLLFIGAISFYGSAVLWLCLPFVKYFISILKRVIFDERSQQEGFFH